MCLGVLLAPGVLSKLAGLYIVGAFILAAVLPANCVSWSRVVASSWKMLKIRCLKDLCRFNESWSRFWKTTTVAISDFVYPLVGGPAYLSSKLSSSADISALKRARFVRFFSFITLLLPGPQVGEIIGGPCNTNKGLNKNPCQAEIFTWRFVGLGKGNELRFQKRLFWVSNPKNPDPSLE